jgi:hypothetical protein
LLSSHALHHIEIRLISAAEGSLGEELVAVVGSQISELKIPATERFSEDYLVTVVGNLGPDLRILDATMISTAAIMANEGRNGLARRTMVLGRGARDFGYARRSATLRRGGARDTSHATC